MVPHDLHVQYAIQCLQSGKHVFLEKPVSHTIEGCIELMKAAESTDKVIMIAENARFWPEVCSLLFIWCQRFSLIKFCISFCK